VKLSFFQFETHLSKSPLAPVYLISGDELLIKNDAMALLRKAAKKAGITERVRLLPENLDDSELYTLLYSSSLLAEKRLIELDCRDHLPTKTQTTVLQAYAEKPATDAILVLDLNKVDDKLAKQKWYQALEKISVHMAAWPVPRDQLPSWILQRAKKYKLVMTPGAANLLADFVEGNLSAAAQAIEKLYLLQSDASIDETIVKSILTEQSRFNLFDFIDNLIAGDKPRIFSILQHLQAEGIEPTLVLWGITRELRSMVDLATHLSAGASFENLCQKYRIFARRQPLVRQFLRKFSSTSCQDLLIHAAQVDQIIKGAAPGHAWEALQLLCLRF
jgi:DNA polymerase III subunit delta